MNGRAPKSPATGSQLVPIRKLSPNLFRAGAAWIQSSNISTKQMSKMTPAKAAVTMRATASPTWIRLFTAGTTATFVAMLLNHIDLLRFFRNNFLWHRRVTHARRVTLARCQHPLQEVLDGFSLLSIGDVGWN